MKKNLVLGTQTEEIYSKLFIANSPLFQISTGITNPSQDYEILRTNSKAVSLEYIYQGEGAVQHNDKVFRVQKGDFLILHENAYHHYYSSQKNPMKKIWFLSYANNIYINTLINLYSLNEIIHLQSVNSPLELEKIFELVKSSSSNNISRELELLLHSLIANLSDLNKSSNKPSNTLEHILLYIEKNVYSNITLDDICNNINTSRSNVFKLFRIHFNMSPHDFIMRKKIDMIKADLTSTNLKINEIAAKYGFNDPVHFSHAFKRYVKMSAQDYKSANSASINL